MSTCKYTYVSTISNSNVRIGSRPEVTLSVPLIWFPLGVIHPGLSLTFILWNRYQGLLHHTLNCRRYDIDCLYL